jgi:DNA-damage-inducible protein D
MSPDEIAESHHKTFEEIKHLNEEGSEYWLGRELGLILGYSSWIKFTKVIDKAIIASEKSGQNPENHFVQVDKMVELGSGATRSIPDFMLSRYACYLIVQNGDPSKPVIANGQTYFAIQTRRQEIGDDKAFPGLTEDQRRLMLRHEMAHHNKALVAAAKKSGVETSLDYAIFQNHGYQGLYGGLGAKDIHAKKGLKKSQGILDHMGSTELAANLFRATQTEEKLRRDKTKGKIAANKVHHDVGAKVRQTIKDLGGTMPECLPTPDKSIKQIEAERKKCLPKADE